MTSHPRRAVTALAWLVALACLLAGPLSAPGAARADELVPVVEVQAYQGGVGWRAPDTSGATSGGDGSGRPLQMIMAMLDAPGVSGGLSYSVCQRGVWSAAGVDGRVVGRAGSPVQALRMELTGEAAEVYELRYRTSLAHVGWLGWTQGGSVSGAPGVASVEAVQVRLVPKGGPLPQGGGSATLSAPGIAFSGYVNSKGWDGPRTSGNGVGEGGRALEGLKLSLTGANRIPGSVRYRVHTPKGWLGWVGDDREACPVDASNPIQAVQMELTGAVADYYDLWYRVYVPNFGWMGCAKGGATAGTPGYRSAQAVQVWLLPKGTAAPGPTDRAMVDVSQLSKIGWQNPSGYYQVSCKNVLPRPGARWPFNYVTPSRIAVDASREDCIAAFVQRAREYVGSPYIWDYACAPGVGVDCVGLVYQCAYATGMDMGEFNPWDHWNTGPNGWHSHDAMNLWNYGKIQRLPLSSREVGDLIFFTGHVGIYIGNDRMIDAVSPRTGVIYESIWSMSPIGVGRLYVR